MDKLLSTTTTISEYLSSDYNITSHISALAYKNELSASEICGYQDTILDLRDEFDGKLAAEVAARANADSELCTKIEDAARRVSILSSESYKWNTSYNTLSVLSGDWNASYDTVSSLSSDWNKSYQRVSALTQDLSSDTIALSNENQVVDLIERNSSKVFINDMVKGEDYGKLDFSVVKIPLSDYELSVVGGTLSDNILYITEEDYLDMYGRQICSLTMSDNEMEKYEGVAATKTYIDTKLQEIKESIIKASESISASLESKDEMKEIFNQIINSLGKMCNELR